MAVLGFCEPNCDWLRILTSRKSFSGSSSQTLVFGGDKRQPEIRLRSQANSQAESTNVVSARYCFWRDKKSLIFALTRGQHL